MPRQFSDAPASANMALPFSYAVTGYAGAGKTMSSLGLGYGVAKAKGCELWVIDTDNRSQEYADLFPHRRVAMDPPYSPGDFAAAIRYCVDKGAGVLVIDCMSDEHDGEGGLLDMRARNPSKSVDAWTPIKEERKKMERYMLSLRNNHDVVFGLTYRADLKYKPKSKDEKLRAETEKREKDPTDKEWSIVTTSDLAFMCSLRFLLPPGSEGTPLLRPTTLQERILMKTTLRYHRFLESVTKLTPDVGQKLYELAKGTAAAPQRRQGTPVLFHRDYAAASGPIEQGTPEQRVAYMRWLEAREVPANLLQPFEQHKALVASMIGRDLGNEAAQ